MLKLVEYFFCFIFSPVGAKIDKYKVLRIEIQSHYMNSSY